MANICTAAAIQTPVSTEERVSPSWSLTKALTNTIGDHRFYR